jgi:hypothetical protein
MSESVDRPPIADAPISVALLVPESGTGFEEAINGWVDYLETLKRAHEILVVGAGSAAVGEAEEWAKRNANVKVVGQDTPGAGASLRAALAAAHHPLFFYADCIQAYAPADLGKLLEFIDHVDLVSGFREPPEARSPAHGWLHRLVLRFVFGLRLQDVDCSFKLFRRSIFARIPIQTDGSFAHAEIMAKANFLGCLIGEVAVRYMPQEACHLDDAARRQRRREALAVFRHPDFGPPQAPPPLPAALAGQPSRRLPD